MYGTNKASGSPLTVRPDVTLKCSGWTAGGTNTGTLTVTSNALSRSTNASITGTLGVTGLTSLMSAVLNDTLGVTGLTSLVNTVLSGTLKM